MAKTPSKVRHLQDLTLSQLHGLGLVINRLNLDDKAAALILGVVVECYQAHKAKLTGAANSVDEAIAKKAKQTRPEVIAAFARVIGEERMAEALGTEAK